MIERIGSLLAGLRPSGQPPTPREVAELIENNLKECSATDGSFIGECSVGNSSWRASA